MALSLESASLVRQKVYSSLGGVSNETANHKLWWTAARELFNLLAKRGVDSLQFIPVDATDATAQVDTGIDAAHKIYFVYLKKRATGTDAFFRIVDDVEGDSITANNATMQLALLSSAEEVGAIHASGLAMANGLVWNVTTAADGETESAAADSPDGFIIVGAA